MSCTPVPGQLASWNSWTLCALPPPLVSLKREAHSIDKSVAIGVSGGVDSMALAFLCSQVRKHSADFKVSDNPVSAFRALVIDHRLRPGSYEEATAVCETIGRMGLFVELYTLNWYKALGSDKDPNSVPNIESLARSLRYQRLGNTCAYRGIASILVAHHEDDQYETLLMRLLKGHGIRGLRGMKKASNIPECEGMFGADASGFIDDQQRIYPFYNMKPSKSERKKMKHELKSHINLVDEEDTQGNAEIDIDYLDIGEFYQSKPALTYEGPNIDVEDGGITMYRPLLEFSKDRLIATCLANNVPWWEDATNSDPTLTTRNAVRHLYKGYTLPKALQKPSILALAGRCDRKVQAQEAEAGRLLTRAIIQDFEPRAGTVTVQFPRFEPRRTGRDFCSPLRRRARFLKQKEVAAILIRNILALVSPEPHLTPLSTLRNFVPRLFPSLATPEEAAATANPPKAFSVCGIYFVPILPKSSPGSEKPAGQQQQIRWYLSRMPYSSTLPVPRVRTTYWAFERNAKGVWKKSPQMQWALWDGRFWVRMEHRLPYRLVVQPFMWEHAKKFRESLTPDDRDRLIALMKTYAPGGVRYTLPAIYLEEPLDLMDQNLGPRPGYPNPVFVDGKIVSMHPKVLDSSKMQLVALPTLGIQLPGTDDWLSCEIRYRKADRGTLSAAGTFNRGPFVAPRDVEAPPPRRRREVAPRKKTRKMGRGEAAHTLK
ncbi:hypothetical protein AAE478_006035 [Parahypoxylon ruwenzoriense]